MNQPPDHTWAEKLMLEAGCVSNSTLEYEELIERVLRLVIAAAGSEGGSRGDLLFWKTTCDSRANTSPE